MTAGADLRNGAAGELLEPAWRLRWRAPELSLVLAERAGQLADARGDAAARVHADAVAVHALNQLGRCVPATGRAVDTLRAAENSGADELGWWLRVDLAGCARVVGAPQVGFALIRPVLAAEDVPPAVRADALLRLVDCLAHVGPAPELDRAAREADRLYADDAVPDGDLSALRRARLAAIVSGTQRRWGDHSAAERRARLGLELLAGLRDPSADSGQLSAALTVELVLTLLDTDRPGRAAKLADSALAGPVRAPSAASAGWLRIAVATRLHLPAGRPGIATDLLQEAADLGERHSVDAVRAEGLLALAQIHEAAGEFVDALRCMRAGFAAERRWRWAVHSARLLFAEAFNEGRPQQADWRAEVAVLVGGIPVGGLTPGRPSTPSVTVAEAESAEALGQGGTTSPEPSFDDAPTGPIPVIREIPAPAPTSSDSVPVVEGRRHADRPASVAAASAARQLDGAHAQSAPGALPSADEQRGGRHGAVSASADAQADGQLRNGALAAAVALAATRPGGRRRAPEPADESGQPPTPSTSNGGDQHSEPGTPSAQIESARVGSVSGEAEVEESASGESGSDVAVDLASAGPWLDPAIREAWHAAGAESRGPTVLPMITPFDHTETPPSASTPSAEPTEPAGSITGRDAPTSDLARVAPTPGVRAPSTKGSVPATTSAPESATTEQAATEQVATELASTAERDSGLPASRIVPLDSDLMRQPGSTTDPRTASARTIELGERSAAGESATADPFGVLQPSGEDVSTPMRESAGPPEPTVSGEPWPVEPASRVPEPARSRESAVSVNSEEPLPAAESAGSELSAPSGDDHAASATAEPSRAPEAVEQVAPGPGTPPSMRRRGRTSFSSGRAGDRELGLADLLAEALIAYEIGRRRDGSDAAPAHDERDLALVAANLDREARNGDRPPADRQPDATYSAPAGRPDRVEHQTQRDEGRPSEFQEPQDSPVGQRSAARSYRIPHRLPGGHGARRDHAVDPGPRAPSPTAGERTAPQPVFAINGLGDGGSPVIGPPTARVGAVEPSAEPGGEASTAEQTLEHLRMIDLPPEQVWTPPSSRSW